MLAFLAILALAAAPAGSAARVADTARVAFVQADVLKVRAAPEADARVAAKARIGTRVELGEVRGDWVKVAFGAGEWRVAGWALGRLLGEAPLGRDEALARAASATGLERLGWLERAVAIDPGHLEAWRELEGAYATAGRKDGTRRARSVIEGRGPGYLATCGLLLAEWSPGAPLKRLDEGRFTREAPTDPLPDGGAELRRLAEEIPGAAWFRLGGAPLDGTAFPRPRVRVTEDDCDPLTGSIDVRLGPCGEEEEPWLATTLPLAPIATEKVPGDERFRRAVERLDVGRIVRLEARRIPGGIPLFEVRFATSLTSRVTEYDRDSDSHVERDVPKRTEGWALFGAALEPLHWETLSADDPSRELADHLRETAVIGAARWSGLALRPGVRVAAIRWDYASGGTDGQTFTRDGYWLVTVEAGKVDVQKIEFMKGSC